MRPTRLLRLPVVLPALAALLVAAAATAPSSAQGLSAEQTEAVEKLIHEYLMDNPEVIIDAVQRYREREREVEAARVQARLAELQDELKAGPSAGNPDASVTLVEFFDYRCGYCKTVLETVNAALEEDSDLRVVFKEYPILSPESLRAAQAALAADKQGKYFEYHNALMAARGSYDDEQIMQIAAEVGLDTERLARDMESPAVAEAIDRNKALARELGITGTPTFVVGDVLVPGAIDLDTMRHILSQARERS